MNKTVATISIWNSWSLALCRRLGMQHKMIVVKIKHGTDYQFAFDKKLQKDSYFKWRSIARVFL